MNTPASFVRRISLKKLKVKLCEAEDRTGDASREAPLETSFRLVLSCASIMGFHLVHRCQDGSYKICVHKVALAVLLYLVSIGITLAYVADMYFKGLATVDNLIYFLPVGFEGSFLVSVTGIMIFRARKLTKYMEELQLAGVKVKVSRGYRYVFIVSLLYAAVRGVCMLLIRPLHATNYLQLVIAAVLNFVGPSLFDIYIFIFIFNLEWSFKKLSVKVWETGHWSLTDVEATATTWLTLTRLLTYHNKVFARPLSMRMSLYISQFMSLTYGLIRLIGGAGCAREMVLLMVPLVEVLVRSLLICLAGDNLRSAHNSVVGGLRRAMSQSGCLVNPRCGQDPDATQNVSRGKAKCDQEKSRQNEEGNQFKTDGDEKCHQENDYNIDTRHRQNHSDQDKLYNKKKDQNIIFQDAMHDKSKECYQDNKKGSKWREGKSECDRLSDGKSDHANKLNEDKSKHNNESSVGKSKHGSKYNEGKSEQGNCSERKSEHDKCSGGKSQHDSKCGDGKNDQDNEGKNKHDRWSEGMKDHDNKCSEDKNEHDTWCDGKSEHGKCDPGNVRDPGSERSNREEADSQWRQNKCCLTLASMHQLISRLEARPAEVEVWGMGRLGQATWVQLAGLHMTYLAVLLQVVPTNKGLQNCTTIDAFQLTNTTSF